MWIPVGERDSTGQFNKDWIFIGKKNAGKTPGYSLISYAGSY
jgi:hypothetical protein